jgi:GntR family transcriptional regulator, rspAB operon transcriptional repressor
MRKIPMNKNKDSLTHQAYRSIKDMIITNQLEPGELINETQMQSLLGIGRTPVHEAFLQLNCEQLVTIIPRKGIEVSRISPQVVNAIFGARKIIEPAVLRQTIHTLDRDWLINMRSLFLEVHDHQRLKEKEGIIEYLRKDTAFHFTLVSSLGNKYLSDLVSNYLNQLMMISIATTRKSSRADKANMDHITIIDYIMDGDVDNACQTLTEHIELSHKDVINNYINS